jgi:hypothetical protein
LTSDAITSNYIFSSLPNFLAGYRTWLGNANQAPLGKFRLGSEQMAKNGVLLQLLGLVTSYYSSLKEGEVR